MRTKAAGLTGMFQPVDQIFVPYRKFYMENLILISHVLGKHGFRGRGVKSKACASGWSSQTAVSGFADTPATCTPCLQ